MIDSPVHQKRGNLSFPVVKETLYSEVFTVEEILNFGLATENHFSKQNSFRIIVVKQEYELIVR